MDYNRSTCIEALNCQRWDSERGMNMNKGSNPKAYDAIPHDYSEVGVKTSKTVENLNSLTCEGGGGGGGLGR